MQVEHSGVTAAGIVLGPMGVLMPPRAWLHTEPITVGIPAIKGWLVGVSLMSMQLLQWVVSAAGMELAFGGTVAPEGVWPQTEPTMKGSVMIGFGLAHHPPFSFVPKGKGFAIVVLCVGELLW